MSGQRQLHRRVHAADHHPYRRLALSRRVSDANFNFAEIKRFAQTLEQAKFDAFFMADHLAVLNMPLEAASGGRSVFLGLSMRVLVAMSGGVDSSVAALCSSSGGHDVVGAYMKNWINEDDIVGRVPLGAGHRGRRRGGRAARHRVPRGQPDARIPRAGRPVPARRLRARPHAQSRTSCATGRSSSACSAPGRPTRASPRSRPGITRAVAPRLADAAGRRLRPARRRRQEQGPVLFSRAAISGAARATPAFRSATSRSPSCAPGRRSQASRPRGRRTARASASSAR